MAFLFQKNPSATFLLFQFIFFSIFSSFLHPNEFKFCRKKKNTEKKNEGTGYDNRDDAYLLKNKFGKFGMMSNKFWRVKDFLRFFFDDKNINFF
jgi:hypothetical protein